MVSKRQQLLRLPFTSARNFAHLHPKTVLIASMFSSGVLLLICFLICVGLASGACNRSAKASSAAHLRQKPSALMATISFESANTSPMFLRTIIDGVPTETKADQMEAAEEEQQIFHQIDSPEDGKEAEELFEGEREGEQQWAEMLDNDDQKSGEEEDLNDGLGADLDETKINAALIGRLCLLIEPLRSVFLDIGTTNATTKKSGNANGQQGKLAPFAAMIEPKAYLECIPFTGDEQMAFGMSPNASSGVWDLQRCPQGLLFDALRQNCTERLAVNHSNCGSPEKVGNETENAGPLSPMPMLHFDGLNGTTNGCYAQCREANALEWPKAGAACAWLGAALQVDRASPYRFLRCQRERNDDPCGKWTRSECSPAGAVFNSAIQLCIAASANTSAATSSRCPENSVPIGSRCAEGAICPGRDSFCANSLCCLSLAAGEEITEPAFALNVVQNYGPVCVGTDAHPIGPCQPGGLCPNKFVCQPGVGCCAQWRSNWDYVDASSSNELDDYEQIGNLVCPGTENMMPEGSCLSCPTGRYCVPRLHGCCPHAQQQRRRLTVDLSSVPLSVDQSSSEAGLFRRCPGGRPFGPSCGHGGCPDGYGCYRGFCCPMQCPPPLAPVSFCRPQLLPVLPVAVPVPVPVPVPACATLGGSCFRGICCQPPPSIPRLPVCPSGQPARIACFGPLQCPSGFECSSGGCCPIPYCPSGAQAVGRCYGRLACPMGSACSDDGLCCPLPMCQSSGAFASQFCGIGAAVACPASLECVNGGCCPWPLGACPMGIVPLGRCNGLCPTGSLCMGQQFCCPLPMCPNRVLANSFCAAAPTLLPSMAMAGGCAAGFECQQGACCPLPFCPGGGLAFGRCSPTGCPSPGFGCFNGLCCPSVMPPAIMPVMPVPVPMPIPVPTLCSLSATVPMSLCGINNACPLGFFCDGTGGCCPLPLPLCPFGGRALQPCIRGADCPPGFGCTSQGGCCRLLVSAGAGGQLASSYSSSGGMPCPYNQYPVCQCAAGQCPSGAACHRGICCSPNVAVSFYQPGMRCRRSSDCQGSQAGLARCVRQLCVCANGAHSNGVLCVRPANGPVLLRQARAGCDEFGSPCRIHLIRSNRMPLFGPEVGKDRSEALVAGGNGKHHGQQHSSVGLLEERPLWFNPIVTVDGAVMERHCLDGADLGTEELLELGGREGFEADASCLPSQKCIRGRCKLRLWPGDRGCSADLQCQSRCSNTFCALETGNGTAKAAEETTRTLGGRCVCRGSFLLFGRCFAECPAGFSRNDQLSECLPEKEETFWHNSSAIAHIQQELDRRRNC